MNGLRRILSGVIGLAMACWATAAGAQTLELLTGLRVIDSNGQLVGDVIAVGPASGTSTAAGISTAVVAFQKGTRVFAVAVAKQGFQSDPAVELWFESEDCTGAAFIRDLRLDLRLLPAVAAIDNVVYVAPVNRPATAITGLSKARDDGTCDTNSGYGGPAVPVVPLEDLGARFTPPFRIRRR
ncbi:MAG: hypothetical protein HYR51_20740 [Candidatus Rokubacteria bacterium]|nr:hypothetical protein [Candidatus Rokubacteria bacterium]